MKHWLSAFRLRTLPLAVSSILVGSALALKESRLLDYGPGWGVVTGLAILTAILLQILSNLANDLGDHQHGTDNKDRVGPQRAVQSGAISPTAMKRAMVICGLLAFASGSTLIIVSLGLRMQTLMFLVLGIAAIGAAVKYTFGKNPYGYAGLGDVSVFLFFGIIGVLGTRYLHARSVDLIHILPAIAFGFLSAGVLNVNNMRDIANDAASGKRTLVVRMGSANARIYHTFLIGGGVLCLLLFTALQEGSPLRWILVPVLGLPLMHLVKVWRTNEPRDLDPQLKVLALSTFFTALVFSFGQLID
jgi:1,4-dihydroxy-2-naphthoate polyprenyltransferase